MDRLGSAVTRRCRRKLPPVQPIRMNPDQVAVCSSSSGRSWGTPVSPPCDRRTSGIGDRCHSPPNPERLRPVLMRQSTIRPSTWLR